MSRLAKRIRDMHRIERPREKLAQRGSAALGDEELLAILLRCGYRGKNVLALARDLLKRHPAERLLQIPFSQLRRLKGVGPTRAAALLASLEFSRRVLEKSAPFLPSLEKPEQVLVHLDGIRERQKEHFVALYLNARNQLIRKEVVSVGTLSESLVHPREVFAPAIASSAAAMVVAHNHPSGDVTPSQEDVKVTRRLVEAGRLLGIPLLDHLIVAQERYFSFRQQHQL
ncbi:MAG: DNA repair protein RadC [Elusimicrobia bacterium]|nr:DNA repair protein RadC [Elusimicrobiota bacterium]